MAVDAGAPAPSQPAAPTEEWPPYADPSYKMPASIEVTVHKKERGRRHATVAIEKENTRKPYLGGYRHRKTGRVYHHASSQSVVLGCLPKYPILIQDAIGTPGRCHLPLAECCASVRHADGSLGCALPMTLMIRRQQIRRHFRRCPIT